MPNIGPLEIIILLVIILVIFGPKRLPELGRSMGRGMREFKDSITGNDKDDDDEQPQRLSPPAAAVEQATPHMQVQDRPAPQPHPTAPGEQNPAEPVQTGEPRA